MRRLVPVFAALLLAACAAYDGRGLRPGAAGLEEVRRVMGPPALEWRDADGSRQLAYPRGPGAVHTFMVRIGPDGRLQSIENVLEPRVFARVTPGLDRQQVLRLLGPSQPQWTVYYPARDELVWAWRYCDDWNQAAHFHVLFDGRDGPVRSTLSLTEAQLGRCGFGEGGGCWCAR